MKIRVIPVSLLMSERVTHMSCSRRVTCTGLETNDGRGTRLRLCSEGSHEFVFPVGYFPSEIALEFAQFSVNRCVHGCGSVCVQYGFVFSLTESTILVYSRSFFNNIRFVVTRSAYRAFRVVFEVKSTCGCLASYAHVRKFGRCLDRHWLIRGDCLS